MEDKSEFGRRVAGHWARWEAGDRRRLCVLCEVLQEHRQVPGWDDLGTKTLGVCPACCERKRLSVKDKLQIASWLSAEGTLTS
jgi:hypothetical protein